MTPVPARWPRLLLVGDGFTDGDRMDRILEASRCLPWIHLRDRSASESIFRERAWALVTRLRGVSPEAMISVSGRLDVAEALGCGYHAGSYGASVAEARRRLGDGALIGFSAHHLTEARAPLTEGAHYVFFSPVFDSLSKPGYAGVGVGALQTFCRDLGKDVPVYALGGITPGRAASCIEVGAWGVAVLSGILAESDTRRAAGAYLAALRNPSRPVDSSCSPH